VARAYPPRLVDCIEPDTSKPTTTEPGSAGTLSQAISATRCRAE
jgi:hypothetical protein